MDSIWIAENFVSLVEREELESGEWLGADVLADPEEEFSHDSEDYDFYSDEDIY